MFVQHIQSDPSKINQLHTQTRASVFYGLPELWMRVADTLVASVFSQERTMQTLIQGFVSGLFKEAGRGPWRKEAIVGTTGSASSPRVLSFVDCLV